METPEDRHNRYRDGGRQKIICRPNQRIVARAHLRSDGTPKVRWPNPTSARFVADLNNWRREHGCPWRSYVQAYYCGFCRGWHVGKPPRLQWFHTMPERHPELLAELGVRAAAIMWAESSRMIRLAAGDTPERRAGRLPAPVRPRGITSSTMRSALTENHRIDNHGRPAGGFTEGRGFRIDWQDGPLELAGERLDPNGAFVEDVIAAAAGRIRMYQSTEFACRENALALTKLEEALHWLDHRTRDRQDRGVEGTHQQ